VNSDLAVKQFAEGECKCPSCGTALPAHETWPGARLRYCGSAKCTEALRQHDNGRYVASNTVKCDADGCTTLVPEGFYGPYTSFLCCSGACWQHRRSKRQEEVLCGYGCGTQVTHRVRSALNNSAYVTSEHQSRHKLLLFLENSFGPFRPLVEEFYTGFAQMHYRDLGSVRTALRRFFRFLNEFGYKSLDEVNCDTITKFLIWAHKNNRGVRSDLLSCISTFFKWLQMTGRRTAGNPVNSFLHRKKKEKRLPRPLSADELKLAWELLCERGDARLRLAFAIGEESGMRIGEICRLRVSDVDATGHRLFVRLPNKTNTERYAHFGPKTARCLAAWLAERDPSYGTDSLLYNYAKSTKPLTPSSLALAFNKVLRRNYEGRSHERGFEKWSTHRLRHTMGTNLAAGGADAAVIMGAGGWVDPDTMAGYVKVNQEQAKRGYEEAMRCAEQRQSEAPKTRVLTPKEVLLLRRGAAQQSQNSPTERCV
jgi:integrase/recombinase XerC